MLEGTSTAAVRVKKDDKGHPPLSELLDGIVEVWFA